MNSKESQFFIDFISNKYLRDAERKKAVELAFKELGENSISMSEKKELRGYLMKSTTVSEPADVEEYDTRRSSTEKEEAVNKIKSVQSRDGALGVMKEWELDKSGKSSPGKLQSSKTETPDLVSTKYHDPRATAKFLSEFNQNLILKAVTHPIDSNLLADTLKILNLPEYSFDKHLDALQKEYKKLSNKYFNEAAENLRKKIYSYIIGDKEGRGRWSTDKIKYSWSCAEIKSWAVKNPGQVPNPDLSLNQQGFKLDRLKLANGEKLSTWNELVAHFQKEIEIRYQNNLKLLISRWIREWNKKNDGQIGCTFGSFNEGIKLRTDVEKIEQLVKNICSMINRENSNNPDSPCLKISLTEESEPEKMILLKILHVDSIFKKSVITTSGNAHNGRDFGGLISNQINGLCDWDLKAEFTDNQFAHIQIWPPPSSDYTPVYLEKFAGVQYEFKFYTS